jgi:hypothetical protein
MEKNNLCLLKMESDITFLLLGDEKQCPPKKMGTDITSLLLGGEKQYPPVEDEVIEDYFK